MRNNADFDISPEVIDQLLVSSSQSLGLKPPKITGNINVNSASAAKSTEGEEKEKAPCLCFSESIEDPSLKLIFMLRQHASSALEQTYSAERAIDEFNLMSDIETKFPEFHSLPPIPTRESIQSDRKPCTRHCLGGYPDISRETSLHLLHRSAAASLALAGYHESQPTALAVLRDVTAEFIKRICFQLRHALDSANKPPAAGFQDVVERTFQQMGCGTIPSLLKACQEKAHGEVKHLSSYCESLHEDYRKLVMLERPVTDENRDEMLSLPGLNDMLDPESDNLISLDDALATLDSAEMNPSHVPLNVSLQSTDLSFKSETFDD